MGEIIDILNEDFAGTAYNYSQVIKMAAFALLILVMGFALWRLLGGYSGGRKRPAKSKYFGNPYADQWEKKIK